MTALLARLFVKGHDHPERPDVRLAYGKLAGWVGILCNLLLSGGKLVAGLLSGSISIAADAVNNLSDAASSVITLVGFKLSAKPADSEHPYGHARFEYIAGLGVAVMVMVIGIELGRGSIERIITPEPTSHSPLTYGVLAASIIIKLWMAVFNRTVGRRIGSATLEATFADSRNDVVTTAAVLVAALISGFAGLELDGVMGLAVAVFILVSGVGLVRDTINPLLGSAPDPELVESVKKRISGYEGVLGTHDLLIHDYGPGRRFASAHVEMSSREDPLESHEIIDQIERDFWDEDKIHLIIHYDPVDVVDSRRRAVVERLHTIHPELTIHDFRVEERDGVTHYYFDVTRPPGFEMDEKELQGRIWGLVCGGDPGITATVTIDNSYAPIPSAE